jgi:hypothetical protein
MNRRPFTLGELPDQVEKWRELNPPLGTASTPLQGESSVSLLQRLALALPKLTFFTADQSVEFTNDGATATTVAKQIIGFNRNRVYLLIQNKSAADSVFVSFGTAKGITDSIEIPAGGNYEPIVGPVSVIYAITDPGALNPVPLIVVSGNRSTLSRTA